MFNKIEIERFRGIKHASIEGFKQINLFFGKNNCGKSTLLESLFLLTGLSNPLFLINLNLFREYKKFGLDDLKLNFYNLDSTQSIHILVDDKETRDLKINVIEKDKNNIVIDTQEKVKLSNETKCDYELKGNVLELYSSSKIARNILESKNNKKILEDVFSGKVMIKNDRKDALVAKISDIMGGEVKKDGGENPFD